tara:strand:+ start:241 stop:387 length:147 start_codon:yes stop_codon:yes gene_type:complete
MYIFKCYLIRKEFDGSIAERGVGIECCEKLKMSDTGQLGVKKNRPITF